MELHSSPLSPKSRQQSMGSWSALRASGTTATRQLWPPTPPCLGSRACTCLLRNKSLPRRQSSLLSRTPPRACGSLLQQASGTSSLSKVRSRKMDANLKSSGPLTPQQPN